MEGHYGGATPFDSSSRKDILRMIDAKIQKLRCNIHLLVVNVNSHHLTQVCPDLSKAERNEARLLYSLVLQLMETQSLLFYGRYTASAIEGACCFEVIMDGNVAKTDRLDPLKLTDIANSAISFVHKVRDQIRSLTRDIVFLMANLLQEFRVKLQLR